MGLIVSKDLDSAYVWMFILGACFPGRVLLALSYAIEFMDVKYHYMTTYAFMVSEPFFLVMLTLWYQFIDRGWLLL